MEGSSSHRRSSSRPRTRKLDPRPLISTLKQENRALHQQKKALSNWISGLTAVIIILFLFLLTRPAAPYPSSFRVLEWHSNPEAILESLFRHENNLDLRSKFTILPEPYFSELGFVFSNPWEALGMIPPEPNANRAYTIEDVKKLVEFLQERWGDRDAGGYLCDSQRTGKKGFHEDVCALARKRFAEAGDEIIQIMKQGG